MTLHIVGSWTAVFPVTTPGPGTADAVSARLRAVNNPKRRIVREFGRMGSCFPFYDLAPLSMREYNRESSRERHVALCGITWLRDGPVPSVTDDPGLFCEMSAENEFFFSKLYTSHFLSTWNARTFEFATVSFSRNFLHRNETF